MKVIKEEKRREVEIEREKDKFILNKWFEIDYNSILVIKKIYNKPDDNIPMVHSRNLIEWSLSEGLYMDITGGYRTQTIIITYPLRIIVNYVEIYELIENNKKYMDRIFKYIDNGVYINMNRYIRYEKLKNVYKVKKKRDPYKLLDIRAKRSNGVEIFTNTDINLISSAQEDILKK